MDHELYIESITEGGKPLFITVLIQFVQNETNDSQHGSKLFWTYEIRKIRASFHGKDGGPVDYTDYLDKEHFKEIDEECEAALHSFRRAA